MSKKMTSAFAVLRDAEPRQDTTREPTSHPRRDHRLPWTPPAVTDVELAAEITAYVGRR